MIIPKLSDIYLIIYVTTKMLIFKRYSAFNIGCFTIIVFLVSCDCYCSVAHPRGAMGLSAVCDCGISEFLTYLENYMLLQMLPR